MKAILTSSLGGSIKINGKRVPSPLMEINGLLDKIKSIWTENAKVIMICASPDNYDVNDSIHDCLKEAFSMDGLSFSFFEICDNRNMNIIEQLNEIDAIILTGGHVPTQNTFMKKLNLKEKLKNYKGIVIAWSAGSMNCSEIVYAAPELKGEAIDPNYQRWIHGLGLTKIKILPHFQNFRGDILDEFRLVEDIVYPDSMGHEILALSDGSYIMIDDGIETLHGEAYSIKNGYEKQICKTGEVVIL